MRNEMGRLNHSQLRMAHANEGFCAAKIERLAVDLGWYHSSSRPAEWPCAPMPPGLTSRASAADTRFGSEDTCRLRECWRARRVIGLIRPGQVRDAKVVK